MTTELDKLKESFGVSEENVNPEVLDQLPSADLPTVSQAALSYEESKVGTCKCSQCRGLNQRWGLK